MRFGVVAAAVIGFAVAVFLILHVGITPILHAVEKVGFTGFVVIVLYALFLNPILASGWAAIAPPSSGATATLPTFMIGRQIRDSAGDVLPFSQLGGIVIGTRAVILRGLQAPLAFAASIADVTTELMAQVAFVAMGVAFTLTRMRLGHQSPLAEALILGTLFMVPGVAVFVVLQTRGGRIAESLAERFLPSGVPHAAAFHQAVNEIYKAHERVAASTGIHLLGWLVSGGGTWVMFRLMGGHISLISAIAIEALLGGLRSAFVFVPSAIGVQEVGYATLAPLFGLPPELGIAASLLKRAREITIGIPVLLAWQAMEGRHALARATIPEA